MKVYLVIENYHYDFQSNVYVTVFDSYEKAKNAFNNFVDREKTNSWISRKYNNINVIVEEENDSFIAYVDGCASEFETSINIIGKDVN